MITIINIIFIYSVGSILALCIARSALNRGEIIEVDGLIEVFITTVSMRRRNNVSSLPEWSQMLASRAPEEIDLRKYYRTIGLCTWAVVLPWLNDFFSQKDDDEDLSK